MDVAVTQATSIATAVTANGMNGLITCFTSKGLCASCYHTQAKKKQKKKHKHEPVVVTHTHEVIRQVQHEEKPMAAHENDKPKAKEASTTVTSDAGETEPTQVFGGDGVTPIAEWEKKWKAHLADNAKDDEKARDKAAEAVHGMMTTKGKSSG